MHKLKISKLVALILLSRVLCLAVVSTAVWELSDLYQRVEAGFDRFVGQPRPDSMRPIAPDAEYQFQEHRFLGKSGLVSECLSDQLRARIRGELSGDEFQGLPDCGADDQGK